MMRNNNSILFNTNNNSNNYNNNNMHTPLHTPLHTPRIGQTRQYLPINNLGANK